MPHAVFSPDELQQVRLTRGLSVTALAASIGKTEGAVLGYESGKFSPTTEVLGRLAGALDCSVSDFFEPARGVAR